MFILTEKPSVAKDIAQALGGFSFQGKTTYDGFYQRGNDCIVFAQGHLLELLKPEDYEEKFKNWKIENLPIIPQTMKYKPISKVYSRLKVINDCFKKFGQDDFILATDPEREGELIGALILDYCGFTKYNTAKRFWVAEALTKDVVLKGLKEAKPLSNYTSYKEAGKARSYADWIMGLNITRLLSIQSKTLLPFGRVQTALLGAIYLREKSIKNFISTPYYQFQLILDTFKLNLIKNDDDCFSSKTEILQITENIHKGDIVTINDIQTEKKTEHPHQLFNLTGLQKHCSKHYNLTPEKTLQIAQSLYEDFKVLSYPRTPSVVLGDENVNLFKEKFILLKEFYPSLAQNCDELKINIKNKRIFNSAKLQDHHALIPLGKLPNIATEEQRIVFNAVLNRFFSAIKPDYIYNSIIVNTECKGLNFRGNGIQVLQKGFKETLENKTPPNGGLEEKEEKFPNLTVGEKFSIKDTAILEKQTKPKPHFSNASLLSLMENPINDNGDKICSLGTPATRADFISKLINRNLIQMQKQNILITEKGTFLIDTVLKNPILKEFIGIATTTQWEEKLETNPNAFLDEIKKITHRAIQVQPQGEVFQVSAIGICPICQNKILENNKSFYCIGYKDKTCNFSIWKNSFGATLTASDAKSLFAGKKTKLKNCTSKTGKTYKASFTLDPSGKLKLNFANSK